MADPDETVPLREYIDRVLADKDLRDQQRYDAQTKALEAAMVAADKAVQAALLAAEKAVNKAEVAAERRFESVNEFRGQLADQAKTFLPRLEYQVQHDALGDKVEALFKTLSDRIEANTKQINEALLSLGVDRADTLARRGARIETRTQANWTMGQIAAIGAALLAAAIALYALLR